ncbi:major capsid protein [Melioribacter sp. OK-6-Me]|uniref:major capsid protein n=1 Tax=unclassified Melioribacter TaxID=2627329 RepID=UPI003ED9F698
MAIQINPFGFAALTEAVNQMIPAPSFVRDLLFKREETFATKTVMVDVVVGGQKILPLVKRGNPGKVMSNTTQKSSIIEPPQLKPKKFLSADDLFYTRGAGAPVFVPGGSPGEDPIQNARKQRYAVEQKDMFDAINRTIEYLCCQGLQGSYSVAQDEGTWSIDFGMPAANKPTLSSAKWDAPTSCTPIKNLRQWKLIAQKASGKIPTVAIMSPATWELFIAADEVVKYMDKLKINIGQVQSDPAVISAGAEKKATIENIDIYVYGGVYTDQSGTQQQLIPDGKVALVSPSADNRLLFGGIDDLEAGTVVAKYFSKDWIEKDPSGLWLLVQSNPLPAFQEPAANIYATVV